MLHVGTLLLALAAAQDTLTIKGSLRELPAEGRSGPALSCEGTANLPDGVILTAYLYYDKVADGRELFRAFSTVKGGAFSQDYPVYSRKNFPGRYVARFIYDPSLQNLGAPDFPRTAVDIALQIGGADDVARESKAVREQLAGELRAMIALGTQVKAKLDELKGKPASDWEPLIAAWRDESNRIQQRADPRQVREYKVLRLESVADVGLEDLSGILLGSARCAAGGDRNTCLEGLTRLNQTAEKWISDIAGPKLTDPGQMAALVDEGRALLRSVADHPDEPVLPSRRKFLEMTELLDKSVPGDFHETVLDIGSRAAAFFIAAADKSAEVKTLHADLDAALQRFADTLRNLK
jgi:hypothetical protein